MKYLAIFRRFEFWYEFQISQQKFTLTIIWDRDWV